MEPLPSLAVMDGEFAQNRLGWRAYEAETIFYQNFIFVKLAS